MNAPQRHVVSTTDLGAFDSYLEGLGQQAVYSYASLNAAENHFKQALSLDPGFTDARLALARNYMLMANTGLIDEDVMRARATPVIDQALDREPDNLQARAYLLALELLDASPSIGDSEVQALLEGMQATLRSLPTETFLRVGVAVTLHQTFNEDERAVEILQEGLLIDPLQPELHRWLGRVHIDTHDLEQARAALERSLELAPDNPNSYGSMSDLERELDNLPGALEWTRRAVEVDPQDMSTFPISLRTCFCCACPRQARTGWTACRPWCRIPGWPACWKWTGQRRLAKPIRSLRVRPR
jgi:tetratricopeptide (TPR) repeat protein